MPRPRNLQVGVVAGSALVALTAGSATAQTYTCGGRAGPDVIVGVLVRDLSVGGTNAANYTASNGIDCFSLGTTSCNVGTAQLLWNALPQNTHPVIGQQCYKFKT